MPVPTNSTPETAITINANTLPYNATFTDIDQVPDDASYPSTCDVTGYHPLWWKITTNSIQNFLAFIGTGDGSVYFPQLSLFTGTPPALVQYEVFSQAFCGVQGLNKWWVCPVQPGGQTYYIRFTDSTDGATGSSTLNVQLKDSSFLLAPPGSPVIPDDGPGFPAMVISEVDGTPLQTPVFAVGELAAILPDGEVCGSKGQGSETEDAVVFFDAQWTQVAEVAFGNTPEIIYANETHFYVAEGSTLHRFSAVGVELDTWTPTSLATSDGTVIVNRAGTIVYYSSGVATHPVRAYDLAGEAPLSDLTSVGAGRIISSAGDGGVLDDGTIWFVTRSSAGLTDSHLLGYSPAGALVFDYTITAGTQRINRAAYYPGEDGESIWVWLMDTATPTIYTYQRIDVTDGSVMQSFTAPGTTVSGEPAEANNPFPIPNSCPLLVLRVALLPPGEDSGSLQVVKVVPSGELTEFSFTAGGGLFPTTFALQGGDSQLYSDVAVGDGYTISETVPDGWTVAYAVSNDSPIDNLLVEDGETTIVTVTNVLETPPETESLEIRWLRRAPVISDENIRLFHTQFTLDMQAGTGLVSGQGSDPQVMLRYSDDSGQTWSEEHWRGSGKIGEYRRRVIWRRLGVSRNRVYEIVGSDPCVIGLIDGYTDVSKGSN